MSTLPGPNHANLFVRLLVGVGALDSQSWVYFRFIGPGGKTE